MTKKFIFGSGIVGLWAKLILGAEWTVIPFYRSRFYAYNPALGDNFIYRNARLDDLMRAATGSNPPIHFYKIAYSVGGTIYPQVDDSLTDAWLRRVYGNGIPPQAAPVMKSRIGGVAVYDVRVNQIYQALVNRYLRDLTEEAALGEVVHVGKHNFTRRAPDGKETRIEFDNVLSTIPLNKLCDLTGSKHSLVSRPVHYFHVQSRDLNFEGNNQLFVVDDSILFYKAANIAPERYLIYSTEEIAHPGAYFMQFMKSFDILDGTTIADAIVCGERPNLQWLSADFGIDCIGSYARWDDMSDIGTNLLDIMDYAAGKSNA